MDDDDIFRESLGLAGDIFLVLLFLVLIIVGVPLFFLVFYLSDLLPGLPRTAKDLVLYAVPYALGFFGVLLAVVYSIKATIAWIRGKREGEE
ncbi:MAG: hypothetical protein FWG08_06550 [Propionibacteriaceae bacterium]|nr:hypothetical protein [Propionibacteriaceae bacterium]